MTGLIGKIWLALVAVALCSGTALAASFTASLDRDSMVLGETANLSLAFEGGQADNVPTPDVPGLVFSQTGTSQSVNIINGAMTSTVTVNFTVTASRTGDFTIPALMATVNGQRLATDPVRLTVTRPGAPSSAAINSGAEPAFMRLVLPKKRLYVGQPMVAQLQLCLRDDVMNQGNFQLPGIATDGFSTGKIVDLQQRRQMQLGNHVYTVIPLALPVTPLKAGSLVLGPFTGSIVVVLPSPDQGGNPFFRMMNQGEQHQVSLATDPVTIESLPLPDQGKPADFTGAIGNFNMTATAGPTNVMVGDPVTVRVQISGEGSLDGVTLPPQDAWQNFKLYPPTAKLETSDQFGFQGTKTFEQIVSPLTADVHEVPAVSFSFFNPDQGRYVTLSQPAVSLVVHPSGSAPMPTLAAKGAAQDNQSPADIMPIKENLGTLVAVNVPLYAHPGFMALQSLPVAAFLAAFVWRRRTDNLANNPRLRRQRAVAQVVAVGLDDLKKFAAANQPDEFFALLFRLLQEQLGERLDCPATAITESAVDNRLIRLGASPATIGSLREFFQLCDQARYAPVRGTGELNSLLGRFQKMIAELQELKA